MEFHLSFPVEPVEPKLNYKDKMLFVGSCFAENIGELMQENKFLSLINPHGILYNPKSIAHALSRYIDNKKMHADELFFFNEMWNSWEHHSRYSNASKDLCLATINEEIEDAHRMLKQSSWLFITFGSAFAYRHIDKNNFVGNCHKVPQKQFEKILLSAYDIEEEQHRLILQLKQFNPKLKIMYTISPVRYIRDGFVENNLSKAQLITAVNELKKKHNGVYYFPAYELVVDDLRDYRFYKQDMVHPNEQAVDYVFEKLKNTLFDDETILLFDEIKNIIAAKKHRPFNETGEAHKKFKNNLWNICSNLSKKYPHLDFTDELIFFK